MSESNKQLAKALADATSAFGELAQALRSEGVTMTGAASIDAASALVRIGMALDVLHGSCADVRAEVRRR